MMDEQLAHFLTIIGRSPSDIDPNYNDDEQCAVRWARRVNRFKDKQYTKWHATDGEANFTLCGWAVPLGLDGTFLPETHEIEKVDCSRCLAKLREG